MSEMLKKYIEKMNFEEKDSSEITTELLENLEVKTGFVCPTKTTDLWVYRTLSVMEVIGVPAVMESESDYTVMDSFGVVIWTGDAKSVLEYITGFTEEK
ncbi:hypothetical protein CN495_07845 [Bacillus thuringiensis]|uniref:Uncharacterized protein n=1 Tax=Bacillus thuringiensis TaxID=1428 RepID=A0ABD6S842_BACTU|nr:hypothetical protein [Bacillus thuringiensis]PER55656.1 hypothetical protein CN495_07845 [Bacillus thuringiensis]